MNYNTSITLGVTVDGGPPAIQQKGTLGGVEAAISRRYELKKECPCVEIKPALQGDDQLLFYAITVEGNRYTYKDCGKDVAGIALNINTGKPWYWISSAQVFIWRPGQSLEDFNTIRVKAAPEMFDCEKSLPQPLTVTVTYGMGSPPDGQPVTAAELEGCRAPCVVASP